jgi:CNH domain
MIPTECFGLFTFNKTIAIPTQKGKVLSLCQLILGFEVLSLDGKDNPATIPDVKEPHLAFLAKRLESTRPLGMYRLSEKEFLLTYDEIAIYVDQHGEVSRPKTINWHGKAKATQVIDGKYVLAFDTMFIEVWRCDGVFGEGGVSLVQIIPGRDIRMIGKEEKKADLGLGPGTGYFDRVYVAMGHPERNDRQVVVELAARM